MPHILRNLVEGDVAGISVKHWPLLGGFFHHRLPLHEIVNRFLGESVTPDQPDVGTLVTILVMNLLSEDRVRLYRVKEWLADKPLPLMVPWRPSFEPLLCNDDRYARVLDTIHAAGPEQLFGAVSLEILTRFALPTRILHADTTSKSFEGEFDTQKEEDEVRLAFGHSKDHRPDLLQLIFGLVCADGVPVAGQVRSGNMSDKIWNKTLIPTIRKAAARTDVLSQPVLYVADSALVTEDNIRLLDQERIDFVSRIPETYLLTGQLKAEALKYPEEVWGRNFSFQDQPKAASYQVMGFEREFVGQKRRFVVVRSEAARSSARKSVNREVERRMEALVRPTEALRGMVFACEADAQAGLAEFLKTKKVPLITIRGEVVSEVWFASRTKRGRPPKDEAPRSSMKWRVRIEVSVDEASVAERIRYDSLFVLVAGLRDVTISDEDILGRYKGQSGVERMWKFMKDPQILGAFCLKTPERIQALAYILLIAAQVATVIERELRMAVSDPESEPLLGLDQKKTRRMTMYALMVVFATLVSTVNRHGDALWIKSPTLNANQQRILGLLGLPPDVFTWKGSVKQLARSSSQRRGA